MRTVRPVLHVHISLIATDCQRLASHTNIESKPVVQRCWRFQEERVFLFDHPADEIRQSAVGVRHVGASLENDDLGGLV